MKIYFIKMYDRVSKCSRNIIQKKYMESMKKYVGNMKEYVEGSDTWKNSEL